MQTGFFVMKDASEVLHINDLDKAKQYLSERIQEFVKAHPKTETKNVVKAQKMIQTAMSIKALSFSVAQFVLAHPSEGLKVI